MGSNGPPYDIISEALVLVGRPGWVGQRGHIIAQVGKRVHAPSKQNRPGHTLSCCFVKQMGLNAAERALRVVGVPTVVR